jgi:hypothetical protein
LTSFLRLPASIGFPEDEIGVAVVVAVVVCGWEEEEEEEDPRIKKMRVIRRLIWTVVDRRTLAAPL